MKKLIQVRVSKRIVNRSGLAEAVLQALENHIADNFALRWSVTKQYLLVLDEKDEIKAINFSKQWNTLTKQSLLESRLKIYMKLPIELLRKKDEE